MLGKQTEKTESGKEREREKKKQNLRSKNFSYIPPQNNETKQDLC